MQSLNDLAAQLTSDDEFDEERALVEAVDRQVQVAPPFLAAATGELDDRYVVLTFTHNDGTALNVTHGDGYTAIAIDGVDYKGYLDGPSLIDVLGGALFGGTSHVRQTRLGHAVGEYFEVAGHEGERLGLSGELGVVPFFLRHAPLLPESLHRTRITFAARPAVAID
jgi:hypothetical protein